MALYLGLDSSTQSLTAIVVEIDGDRRAIVFQHTLEFDREFPCYGTSHGVLPNENPVVAHSSPLMWAAALDRAMGIVSGALAGRLRDLRAISGAAQQHGSVYLNERAERVWAALDPGQALAPQLDGLFSRQTSPIWMDASTSKQCAAIATALGGDARVATLTGSRPFERFAGPQIRKFFEEEPECYARTATIHLVSSFLASLLAGHRAPIDPGDGAGMNLMALATRAWSTEAMAATAPGLADKLPAIVPSWTAVGPLAPYWRGRHGFPPANVVAWSGDNPCSLVGIGLVEEGRVGISLGTSDTLFAVMRQPRVDPLHAGHVFGSPTGDYMGLLCFANGALARERIRDEYRLDWRGFSGALRATPPGNGGAIMLPWVVPEITPLVTAPAIRRYDLRADAAAANVRALVEGQMLSMAVHSAWTGVRPKAIHATGGASVNREILRVMADVHDATVYQLDVPASAALGAALRAFHADELSRGRQLPWQEVVAELAEPSPSTRIEPIPENVRVYEDLKRKYAACEANALACT